MSFPVDTDFEAIDADEDDDSYTSEQPGTETEEEGLLTNIKRNKGTGRLCISRSKTHYLSNFFLGSTFFYKTTKEELYLCVNEPPSMTGEQITFKDAAEALVLKPESFSIQACCFTLFNGSFVLKELLKWEKVLFYYNIIPVDFLVDMCIRTFLFCLLTLCDLEKQFSSTQLIDTLQLDPITQEQFDKLKELFDSKIALETKASTFCDILFSPVTEAIKQRIEKLETYDITELDVTGVSRLSIESWFPVIDKYLEDRETMLSPDNDAVFQLTVCVETLGKLFCDSSKSKRRPENKREFRCKVRHILEDFFNNLRITKIMKEGGIVFSTSSLPALLNYAINLSHIASVNANDAAVLQQCIDRITGFIGEGGTLPLSQIKKIAHENWLSLRNKLKDIDVPQLDELESKFCDSVSYEEAWSYALRMKGALYEMLYAKEYKLNYVKEHLKLSIAEIIKVHFPAKYDLFITRSGKYVYLRDYHPDFYIITDDRGICLRPESLHTFREGLGVSSSDTNLDIKRRVEPRPDSSGQDPALHDLPRAKADIPDTNLGTYLLKDKLNLLVEGKRGKPGQCIKHNIDQPIDRGKLYLTLIEVGYQTDASGKTEVDFSKYRPLIDILKEVDIHLLIITVADRSTGLSDCSWLSKDSTDIIKQWVSRVFAQLTSSMPVGITDVTIGDISTRKLRSRVQYGHVRRTPVTSDDILNYYREHVKDFIVRPSGAVLPETIQKQMVINLVYGSHMDKESSDRIYHAISSHSTTIIDSVNKSKLVWQITDNVSCCEYVMGMLSEVVESYSSTGCPKLGGYIANFKDTESKLKLTAQDQSAERELVIRSLTDQYLNFIKEASELHRGRKGCCPSASNHVRQSWTGKMLLMLCDIDLLEVDHEMRPPPKLIGKSLLDKLCHVIISSRTGKQKDAKMSVVSVLEYISKFMDGFLRDGKGTIIGTYGYILMKLGMKKPKGVENEDVVKLETTIDAVKKAPKTQKRIDKDREHQQRNTKEFLKTLLNKVNICLKKKQSLTGECCFLLDELKEVVGSGIDSFIGPPQEFIKDILKPGSYVESTHLNNALRLLLEDSIQEDTLKQYFETTEARKAKFEDQCDDRYPFCSAADLRLHLEQLSGALDWSEASPRTKILHQDVVDALLDRLGRSTVPGRVLNTIVKFCYLMLKSSAFRILLLYSKICESYINFSSEMSNPGIKIGKIKDYKVNLIAKVTKKKETNSVCLLTDLDYKVYHGKFYMNRSKAVMGQSLIYCELITLFQSIQTQGLYLELEDCNLSDLVSQMERLSMNQTKELTRSLTGILESGIGSINWKPSVSNHGVDRSYDLALLVSSFTSTAWLVIAPALMNNSRKISKLLQMLRYQLVISTSDFSFPLGAGKKSCISLRRLDHWAIYLLCIYCSYVNIRNRETNIQYLQMLQGDQCSSLISFQLWPLSCVYIRQALSDIYICHIFNKEMDDFDEGSIRVLNEYVDKVQSWERDVADTCTKFNRLKKYKDKTSADESRDCLTRLRCLLGIKNVSNLDSVTDNDLLIAQKTTQTGYKKRVTFAPSPKAKVPRLSGESTVPPSITEKFSSTDTSSSSEDTSLLSDHESYSSLTTELGRLTMSKMSKFGVEMSDPVSGEPSKGGSSISLWSFNESDMARKTRTRVDEVAHNQINDLLRQCKAVCSSMKPYTFGVAEISQAFVERSKCYYTHPNISRALKSPKNHEQISKISETTSILADSLLEFNLESSIRTITTKDAIKLGKTLNRTNRIRTDTGSKFRNFEKEISNIILSSEEDRDHLTSQFITMIEELRKSSGADWRSICSESLTSVIMTDNCSRLYSFIKSIWRHVKALVGKKGLCELRTSCNAIFEWQNSETGVKQEDIDKVTNVVDTLRSKLLDSVHSEFQEKILERTTSQHELLTCEFKLVEMESVFTEAHIISQELEELQCEHPDVSYPELECSLRDCEQKLFKDFDRELFYICCLTLAAHSVSTFTLSSKSHSRISFSEYKKWLSLGNSEAADYLKHGPKRARYFKSLSFVANSMLSSALLEDFLNSKYELLGGQPLKDMVTFCRLLLCNIRQPITCRLSDVDRVNFTVSDLEKQLESIYVKSHPTVIDFDIGTTISLVIKGSVQLGRRLLNRQEQGVRLPRSPRSKVIYEMLKLSKLMNTTSVQQMGFEIMKDKNHNFFASLAPKAQIGGDRDLLVMERQTKVAIHCTETASKSLMESSVNNDGLTNKRLKEEIIEKAQHHIMVQNTLRNKKKPDDILVDWSVVEIISGDCTKWGPIHCPSFFSLNAQQLFSDKPDWCAAYMIVMLKSLNKRLEIPCASVEKIIRTLIGSKEFRNRISRMKKEKDEAKKLATMYDLSEDLWKNNSKIKELVKDFLSKGKRSFTSYNHMGQGIHHGTSSLHGNCCSITIDEIIEAFIERKLPGITAKIEHAGSSDDFAKIISLRGTVSHEAAARYDKQWKMMFRDALNFMSGIMRCCQMMVSEKSVTSPILAEFYSEFNFGQIVQPSTAKFINSQIINNSITTPLTLYQSCKVDSQQAMYMGVPLATIILLCMFKQNIFISNSEEFYDKYARFICNSFAAFGRVYFPLYSDMLEEGNVTEEIRLLRNSLGMLVTQSDGDPINEDEVLSGIPCRAFTDSVSSFKASKLSDETSPNCESDTEVSLTETSSDLLTDEPTFSDTLHHVDNTNIAMAVVLCKYYTDSGETEIEDGFSRLDRAFSLSLTSDPFLQLMPESVRSRIKQVRELKTEFLSKSECGKNDQGLKTVAVDLITKSAMTEKYEYEIDRLQQALDSRTIVWGLSGGIRGISLPIHRQMLRSYLFENRTPINVLHTWLKTDESEYIREDGSSVKPKQRVKFRDFLDCLKAVKLIPDPSIEYRETNDITCFADIPVTLETKPNGETVILYHPTGIANFCCFLDSALTDMEDVNLKTVQEYEQNTECEIEQLSHVKVGKTKMLSLSSKPQLFNSVSVIIAFILDHSSVYDATPVELKQNSLSQDVHNFQNMYPTIMSVLNKLKQDYHTKVVSATIAKDLSRKLLTFSRMVSRSKVRYLSLYVLYDGLGNDYSVDHSTLFRTNLIEKCELKVEQVDFVRVQDTFIYDIMGVINVINWSDLPGHYKNILLLRLLRFNLRASLLPLQNCIDQCGHCAILAAKSTKVEGGTCSSLLLKESQRCKGRDRSNTYSMLSRLPNNYSGLLGLQEDYEVTSEIDYRGTSTNGYFTYSCSNGTACGTVIGSIVYILINPFDSKVLDSLEGPLLRELNYTVSDRDPYRIREYFFRLLPLYTDMQAKVSGDYGLVELCNDGTLRLHKRDNGARYNGKARVVWISGTSLVTQYEFKKLQTFEPILKWTSRYLYILLEKATTSINQSNSIDKLLNAAAGTLSKKEMGQMIATIAGSTKRVFLCKIKTDRVVSQISLAIYHILVKHSGLSALGDSNMVRQNSIPEVRSTVDDPTEVGIRFQVRSNAEVGSDPEEGGREILLPKIKQLLTDRKIQGLESVYPLFMLLQTFGLGDVILQFDGISERSVGSVGSWNIIDSSKPSSNSLTSVMESLSKSLKIGKYTEDTFRLDMSCTKNLSINEIINDIESNSRMINNDSLANVCFYLALSYISIHYRLLISPNLIFTDLINKIINNPPNCLVRLSPQICLSLSTTKAKVAVSVHLDISEAKEMERKQQVVKEYYTGPLKQLVKWKEYKTSWATDLELKVATIAYNLSLLLTRKDCLETLDSVFQGCLKHKKQKSALRLIFKVCVDMVSMTSCDIDILQGYCREWYLDNTTIKRSDKMMQSADQEDFESFLKTFEDNLEGAVEDNQHLDFDQMGIDALELMDATEDF